MTRSISSPTNDKPEIPNPWQTRSPWDTSKGMLLLIEGFQTSMSHHILDQIKVTSGPDFDKHTPTLNLSTSRLHQDASRSIKKRKTHQKRHQKSRNIKRHQDASRNQRRIKKHQETKNASKYIKTSSRCIKKHQESEVTKNAPSDINWNLQKVRSPKEFRTRDCHMTRALKWSK